MLSEIQYDDFDVNWLLGLASTFRHTQQFDKTYMLTKANLLLTQQKYSEDKMLALLSNNKTLAAKLDKYAQTLIDALKNGNYSTSSVRKWLEPAPQILPAETITTEPVPEK